jgi:hypothetical protein
MRKIVAYACKITFIHSYNIVIDHRSEKRLAKQTIKKLNISVYTIANFSERKIM